MRIVFSGGGTLGHIYPMLPVIKKLKKDYNDIEIIYIGGQRDQKYEAIMENNDIDQKYFFNVIGLSKGIKNISVITKLIKGINNIKKIYQKHQPDIVIGMGGYISAAAIIAAQQLKISTIIHEQNSIMGLANKIVLKKVKVILTSFPIKIKNKFQNKLFLIGNPRFNDALNYQKEYNEQNRIINSNSILITSGTLGSKAINDFAITFLNSDVSKKYTTTLICGKRYYDNIKEQLKPGYHYQLIPFSNQMLKHLSNSKIVICRSGATTLFEVLGSDIVPIFIPSPNVTGNHQFYNAKYIVDQGLGYLIKEDEMSIERITSILEDIASNRNILVENKIKRSFNDATNSFCNHIINVVGGGKNDI